MAENFRKEQPGEYGTELVSIAVGPIGPANYLGGAAPLTVNDTTIFRLGGFGRRVRFAYMVASATTIAADPDGTTVATCYKYDAVANAQVAVTGTLDLETMTAREATVVPALAGGTDAALTALPADTFEVSVVNTSAAMTQPAGLYFRVFAYALD